MAGYIAKLRPKSSKPWKAVLKKKGYKTRAGWFVDKPQAEKQVAIWTEELEYLDKGMTPPSNKKTIDDLGEEYLRRRSPKKATYQRDETIWTVFRAWNNTGKRKAHTFTIHDAEEYKDYLENEYVWLGKPYIHKQTGKEIIPNYKPKKLKPASIELHIAILSAAWNLAGKKWRGFESLLRKGNPWSSITPSDQKKERTRRLREGELKRLEEACKGCYGKYKDYAPLAIYMALNTGMRRQEIFALEWSDINIKERTIRIKHDKTSHKKTVDGRIIALPFIVEWILSRLKHFQKMYLGGFEYEESNFESFMKAATDTEREMQPHKLFPFTKEQFTPVWVDILKRAGIPSDQKDYIQTGTDNLIKADGEGLHFHDLRREADLMFEDAGLTEKEHDYMMGHAPKGVGRRIYNQAKHVDPKKVADKIDKHLFGKTRDEIIARGKENAQKDTDQTSRSPNVIQFKAGSK